MSELLVVRGLLFAGECFLASLVLPLLAFAVTALLKRAALRHLAWTTMFGVLAVLPLAALLLPPRRIVEHVAAPVADVMPAALPVMAAPPPPAPLGELLTPGNIVLALVALWLLGLAWQGLRFLVGSFGLLRLRHRSAAFAFDLQSRCEVRLARDEDGPSTFGILRPIVLLPRSAESWPPARLAAVLAHEAAHVARRDAATQGLARLVCALYWLNPLLWLGLSALRCAAEIAADDAVLAGGMAPSVYAAELVGLAAERRGVAPGIAMAGPPLRERVEAVLTQNASRKGVTRMDMARMGLLGLTATLLLGAARFDLAVAQDAPAPKVEKTIDLNIAQDVAVKAKAAAIKARADAVAARAKAKAEAETDPVKREQYRKQAAQVAAQSAALKAEAEQMAVDSTRALAHAEEARKAAQDVATTQTGDVLRRTAADKARAEDMRKRADVLAGRVGNPALSERERIAAAQDMAEGALARTADAFARQAQMLKGSGDAGKQQLNQLAADSIAVARQELAQARADAARPGHAEASASGSADSSVTINGATYSGNVQMQQSRPGGPVTITADRFNRALPQGNDDAGMKSVGRYQNSRDGVRIDIQVDPIADAANNPDARNAIRDAVAVAMAEASTKITAAIAEARVKAGLPAKPPIPALTVTPVQPVKPSISITTAPPSSITVTPHPQN